MRHTSKTYDGGGKDPACSRLAALRVQYMTAQAIQAVLVMAMAQTNGCHEQYYTDFSYRTIAERENAAQLDKHTCFLNTNWSQHTND